MKVLIVTGGLVSGVEASTLSSLRRLFDRSRDAIGRRCDLHEQQRLSVR